MRVALAVACLLLAAPLTAPSWSTANSQAWSRGCTGAGARRGRGQSGCAGARLMREATRGAAMGADECAHQFRDRRWNCTTLRRSMRKILMRDTRETSFVNAITAAGVTYAITRACSNGALVECSCERRKPDRRAPVAPPAPSPPAPAWRWGGCGDDVRFGNRKSRDLMEARYRKRSDIKVIIKLHNNNAGRLAIKNYLRPECKCHGLSGSCTLKTCWLKMPPFRQVGDRLKERFDGAAKVTASNDGKTFIPEGASVKPPSKQELVYTEESPDFCRASPRTGSLGTLGRRCARAECDLLCCGRGYSTDVVRETYNCRCKFEWCCNVVCETCEGRNEVYTCL